VLQVVIADGLRDNNCLCEFSLDVNDCMTNECGSALMGSFPRYPPSLQELNIYLTFLSDYDSKEAAEATRHKTKAVSEMSSLNNKQVKSWRFSKTRMIEAIGGLAARGSRRPDT
jgi:hypothetical protein